MKKSISVFLATLACLSVGAAFTACGGEEVGASSSTPEVSTPTEDEVFSGVSEEEWNAAIAPISFENYTMIADASFTWTFSDYGTTVITDQAEQE